MKTQSQQSQAYTQALYIKDARTLADYCQQLKTKDWIAVDTEFVRVDTYFPELSLIQIADPELNLALIDPIALTELAQNALKASDQQPERQPDQLSGQEDKPNQPFTTSTHRQRQAAMAEALAPFLEILEDPRICKVFHSARQDLEVLYVLHRQLPSNIFDTQLAAIFRKLGDLAGFARVIQAELNIKLAKSQTRTNWHNRPLSDEQIHYALDDVYFLAQLYQKYQSVLTATEKTAVSEDCHALLNPELYQTPPAIAWHKIKGIKNLKPKQLAIVQTLAQWRESYAQMHNKPKKWTLSDEVILHIAKRPPKTAQALYKVPNIKASSVKSFGETWITLIDEVFASAPENYPSLPPKPKPVSPQEDVLLQLISAFGHQIALDYHITPTNFLQKSTLLDFLRATDSLSFKEAYQGWRKTLFYRPVEKFLNNEQQLEFQHQRLQMAPKDQNDACD